MTNLANAHMDTLSGTYKKSFIPGFRGPMDKWPLTNTLTRLCIEPVPWLKIGFMKADAFDFFLLLNALWPITGMLKSKVANNAAWWGQRPIKSFPQVLTFSVLLKFMGPMFSWGRPPSLSGGIIEKSSWGSTFEISGTNVFLRGWGSKYRSWDF